QPARPLPAPRPALSARGAVWRVVVGGQRATLRTTEAADGTLAEIALSLGKEGSTLRGLLDGFVQSVNVGLARGLPLSDYVTAFAYTRFGPAGAVEGDAEILCATSVLDWAFRRLAIAYQGGAEARRLWPDPTLEECAPDALGTPGDRGPMLPLDLPTQPSPAARRRSFRLVG
ncbi:vitamin B12-dependent ribonucleotide reductase, partial [Roseomonas sp. GC11]|nr:vitamin B12-dependent ribonucleotide reductase [Roseomonas sp. GC11]